LRNWASEKARKAERRGMLEGRLAGGDVADRYLDDASAAVITSSIETLKSKYMSRADSDTEIRNFGINYKDCVAVRQVGLVGEIWILILIVFSVFVLSSSSASNHPE